MLELTDNPYALSCMHSSVAIWQMTLLYVTNVQTLHTCIIYIHSLLLFDDLIELHFAVHGLCALNITTTIVIFTSLF
jgi:hypothetical protein